MSLQLLALLTGGFGLAMIEMALYRSSACRDARPRPVPATAPVRVRGRLHQF